VAKTRKTSQSKKSSQTEYKIYKADKKDLKILKNIDEEILKSFESLGALYYEMKMTVNKLILKISQLSVKYNQYLLNLKKKYNIPEDENIVGYEKEEIKTIKKSK